MTWSTTRTQSGKQAVEIFELDLPRCIHTYGTAPCTASGGPNCYNFFRDCQDTANFASADDTLRFASAAIPMPGRAALLAAHAAAPMAFDDFETDAFLDGWPDGWDVSGIITLAHETGGDVIAGAGSMKLTSAGGGLVARVHTWDYDHSAQIRVTITVSDPGSTWSTGDFTIVCADNDGTIDTQNIDPAGGTQSFDFQLRGSSPFYIRIASATSGDVCIVDDYTVTVLAIDPADLRAAYFAYPAIDKIVTQPLKLSTTGKIGRRAAVRVTLRDFPGGDTWLDPYASSRATAPQDQPIGFIAWLLRLMPYLEGKPARIRRGYSTDPWDWDQFRTEHYIIDHIEQGADGEVQVVLKDPLTELSGKRAQCPVASDGYLAADIDAVTTSATLAPAGIGTSDYPASGYLRINDEVVSYTRSADTLTIVRGQLGSTADSHEAGDTAQQVTAYEDQQIEDILEDQLTTYGNQPSSRVPTATWAATAAQWFPGMTLTGYITEPTPVEDLVEELLTIGRLLFGWDPFNQVFILDSLRPPRTPDAVDTLTETAGIVEGSVKVTPEEDDRLTQVWIHYDQRDVTEAQDERRNYRTVLRAINADTEAANAYGTTPRIRKIFTRWLQVGGDGIATQTAQRLLTSHADVPQRIQFDIDVKDADAAVGDLVNLQLRELVTSDGAIDETLARILSIAEPQAGHRFRCEARKSGFRGRYFFIAPDGLNDYASESAASRLRYGFISDASGLMSDGTEAYKII